MLLFARMIWVDYTIAALMGFYLLFGLMRGATKEAIALFAWLLAIAVGWCFALEFSVLLIDLIQQPVARMAAALIGLVMLTRTLVSILFYLGRPNQREHPPSWLSHLFGMAVGLVRGAVIVTLVILVAGLTPLPKDAWWQESCFIPAFQTSAAWFKDHVPSGLAGYIHFG